MTTAARIPLSSLANGTVVIGGSNFPANGATAFVYQHGTTTQVTVYAAEAGGTTLSQPLTADGNGQLPGWVVPGQDLDVVATFRGTTAPAALAEPLAAQSVVNASRTKRVTLPITGDGNAGSLSTTYYMDLTQRILVELPVTTTRWRLRIANTTGTTPTLNANALAFKGVAIGTPAYDANSPQWHGNFTAAPTQALGAFNTNSDGSDFTTGWVTDPTLQFTKHVQQGLSWGYVAPNGTNIASASYGGVIQGNGNSGLWNAQNLSAALMASSLLDVRLEFEFVTDQQGGGSDSSATIPVVLAIGDSITRGTQDLWAFASQVYQGGGDSKYPHQNWFGSAALRNGFAPVNLAVAGATTANYTSMGSWYIARADLATTVPDAAVLMIGTNDCNTAVALATIQANIATIIANLRAIGINRIYVGTLLPRNFALPTTYEVDSVATSGAPTGGTIQLPFSLLGRQYYTTAIAYNATAAAVAAAVQACLPTNMPNAVVGSGGPLGTAPVTLTFQNGAYGPVTQGTPLNSLTGGTSPNATFTQTTPGQTNAETERLTLNNWLRQLPLGIEGVFDFDKRMRLEGNAQIMDGDFCTAGQVHPNAAGHQLMAGIATIR